MNDMYEKGYQDGYAMGRRDGEAKGWHEAMRHMRQKNEIDATPRSSLSVCPKCQVDTAYGGHSCQSWACPMSQTPSAKTVNVET